MPKHSQPRRGSLQFWPRKRAEKCLPSVNWVEVCKRTDKKGFLGFIGYKVGMSSCVVKDNTEQSLTKGQKIIFPVTFVECPPLKILSVRFYKNHKVSKEIFAGGEKDLKKKIKIGKKKEKINMEVKDYDNIRILAYSLVSRTAIKKSPDIIEIGLGGSKEEQLATAKDFLNKEIQIDDVFKDGLVDIRGVTKGKGLQGPVKRFGISLRAHKSEKGVRKVGSIGPWHPARVMSMVPMAGQTGFFSRVVYNTKIIGLGKIADKDINPKQGFKHYGKIKTSYLILKGSVQGPAKRQVLLTSTIRPTKKQSKKNMEFIKIEK
jgi:large subunit ribosomal protein L3